jgi:aromatic-L-amino-acid decarboxylase
MDRMDGWGEGFAEMLELLETFSSKGKGGGVIQDAASTGALCALLAACERATDFATNERGCDGTLVAYTTFGAHSSIEKAMKIAGIGRRNLRLVSVDENFAMRPGRLRECIVDDLAAGVTPFFVSATIGTTSSNAIDPMPAIGRICREAGLWLHVDAPWRGPQPPVRNIGSFTTA